MVCPITQGDHKDAKFGVEKAHTGLRIGSQLALSLHSSCELVNSCNDYGPNDCTINTNVLLLTLSLLLRGGSILEFYCPAQVTRWTSWGEVWRGKVIQRCRVGTVGPKTVNFTKFWNTNDPHGCIPCAIYMKFALTIEFGGVTVWVPKLWRLNLGVHFSKFLAFCTGRTILCLKKSFHLLTVFYFVKFF